MHGWSQQRVCAEMYRGPIKFACQLQLCLGLVSLLLLDGGRGARLCGCAMLGFWLGVGIILFRRPFGPTRVDLTAVRWGFLPLLVGAGCWAAFRIS